MAMVLKVLSWAGKTVATVLIVCVLSIWTTGYIITSYVELILKQYSIPIDVPPIAMSGIWGTLWGSDSKATTETEEVTELPNTTEEPVTQQNTGVEVDDEIMPEDDAQEVMAPIELDDQEVAMTEEEFGQVKSTISEADNARMLELLMTKLPPDSWQTFSTYIEDGLTDQELLSIQQMMAQHLNEDEYKEIMSILERYDES